MADDTAVPTSLPCTIAALVPHKPPILINGDLLKTACSEAPQADSAVRARAPVDGPFIYGEHLLPEYFIELMAQSTAALQGYCSSTHGKHPGTGFLASVDRFSWHAPGLRADQFDVTFREIISFDSVHLFEGEVKNNRGLICEGRFKIWAEENNTVITNVEHAEYSSHISIPESLARDALVEVNDDDASGTFTFSESFPGFQGHFPGNPVLPAVFQTASVQLLAEKILATGLTAVSASNIKFEQTITPQETVRLSLQMQKLDGGVIIVFILTGESGCISSGELTYSYA